MSQVPKNLGHGEGGGRTSILEELNNGEVDDLNTLRDSLISLLQKLDADAGTETNYESSLTPSALSTKKSK